MSSAFAVAIEKPELVFGIIGAVGTNTDRILEALKSSLTQVNYRFQHIRLIDGIRQFEKWKYIEDHPLDVRYTTHMDAGNEFRELFQRGDAVALSGIAAISQERVKISGSRRTPISSTAYALRSLKRPEEVSTLRQVYGRNFYALAAYSTRQKRFERLASQIALSRSVPSSPGIEQDARGLIERDEAEQFKKFGQKLRGAFPISDFFVDADSPKLEEQVRRIVELIFGNTFHTPSREEFGMFHAWSASLRSASLGRQVGAAVCTRAGELQATGCNEVPKAGGGQYWPDDHPDGRDHQKGEDSNDVVKNQILSDLLNRLKTGKWLTKKKASMTQQQLLDEALADKSPDGLASATLMEITEYGRMVHAEMAALMQAAQLGIPVGGSSLFTTTFPCHNCAKHIVAAGISRVTFIEPYPKSRALELHGDSITLEPDGEEQKTVAFKSFVGVSPRQYSHLFSLGDSTRKAGTKVKSWKAECASPRFAESPFAYLANETEALTTFDSFLNQNNLNLVEG